MNRSFNDIPDRALDELEAAYKREQSELLDSPPAESSPAVANAFVNGKLAALVELRGRLGGDGG